MPSAVEILGERVEEVANVIVGLRRKIQSLERELAATDKTIFPPPLSPPPTLPDQALVEELERLRAERIVIRENIRGLLREIDRVAW